MRCIDQLTKTSLANQIFREVNKQDIPAKGKFIIEIELSKKDPKVTIKKEE